MRSFTVEGEGSGGAIYTTGYDPRLRLITLIKDTFTMTLVT